MPGAVIVEIIVCVCACVRASQSDVLRVLKAGKKDVSEYSHLCNPYCRGLPDTTENTPVSPRKPYACFH